MSASAAQSAAADRFAPVEFLAAGARRFGKSIGSQIPRIDYRRVRLDPTLGQWISDAYMTAMPWQARALPAYRALRRETIRQFRFLISPADRNGLGVTVEIVDHDPYDSGTSAAEDLMARRLKVYSSTVTGNPHPFLTDHENNMLRAVHDAFGHAASGCGFDRDGEEAAWLKHSFLYSALARKALATETRGQSCAQSFHYGGRRFPEQKLILLPERFSDPWRRIIPSSGNDHCGHRGTGPVARPGFRAW